MPGGIHAWQGQDGSDKVKIVVLYDNWLVTRLGRWTPAPEPTSQQAKVQQHVTIRAVSKSTLARKTSLLLTILYIIYRTRMLQRNARPKTLLTRRCHPDLCHSQ